MMISARVSPLSKVDKGKRGRANICIGDINTLVDVESKSGKGKHNNSFMDIALRVICTYMASNV